jgi:bifunctional UDP-N-acetylglucosamine pyrophosphorylase/glucosamine-1-phosphate N-acetyltransferase
MKKIAVVILAAGEGTRMKSATPKVLHTVAGRPMLEWVVSAVSGLKPAKTVVVLGHHSQLVADSLSGKPVLLSQQKERLGTAHALKQAAKHLKNFKGDLLVICGDTPLVSGATLEKLVASHSADGNAATILSANAPEPYGYGRINRLEDTTVAGIVEEKDCNPQQRLISEINSGMYCFSSPLIWPVLSKIKNKNAKKEYYLTDAIEILRGMGKRVDAKMLASIDEIMGVNDRAGLAVAEGLARRKILRALMLGGVTVENPETTTVGPDVTIGADTVLKSGSVITGECSLGTNCEIGPYTSINNTVMGNGCSVVHSFVTDAVLENDVHVGPFAHLRPGTVLKTRSKVGNFSEVKKSVVGYGSKVNHLSYIGDAELGNDVNVGAGTITCNYDGKNKFKTVIHDGAFIGSNTNLVAPVTVGAGALIAAGSTITEDIPAGMLALARARQVNKLRKKK